MSYCQLFLLWQYNCELKWKITKLKADFDMHTENSEVKEKNLASENENTNEIELNEELVQPSEVESQENVEEEISIEKKLESELAEMKDKYIRMYSEFENFRRRTAKEKIEMIQNASQGLIKDLIPVVDDFERAQKSFDEAKDIEPIKEGIELIYNKLFNTLAQKGLKAMDSKESDFDVELHECITQIDLGENNKGKIVDVIEKGYYLNEKVVRYAKVVVGK